MDDPKVEEISSSIRGLSLSSKKEALKIQEMSCFTPVRSLSPKMETLEIQEMSYSIPGLALDTSTPTLDSSRQELEKLLCEHCEELKSKMSDRKSQMKKIRAPLEVSSLNPERRRAGVKPKAPKRKPQYVFYNSYVAGKIITK